MEKSFEQRPRRLVTVKQLHAELGGALSIPAIRDHVYRAEERTLRGGRRIASNGLAPAIIKLGSKVLIDFDLYFEWLESHRLAPRADLEALRHGDGEGKAA